MQTKDILQKLRRFDAYPKTLEDFRVKTFGGAASESFLSSLAFRQLFNRSVYSSGTVAQISFLRVTVVK